MSEILSPKQRIRLASELIQLRKDDPLVTFEPFGMQQEVIEVWNNGGYGLRTPPAGIVLAGGYRSSKSTVAGRIFAEELVKKETDMFCLTVDENTSIIGQQRVMADFIPKWSKGKNYRYTKEKGYVDAQFSLSNKSQCLFKFYSQHEDTRQASKQKFHWYDEEIDIRDFNLLQKRLWDMGGRWIMSAVSVKGMTPLLNKIHRDAVEVKSKYAKYVDMRLPTIKVNKKMKVIIFYFWTLDNPHIEHDKILADIEGMSFSEKMVALYGIPSNLGGVVYPTYSRSVHEVPKLSEKITVKPDWKLVNVVDPHDDRPWAMAWCWFDPRRGRYYFIEEWPNFDYNTEEAPAVRTWGDYANIIRLKELAIRKGKRNPVERIIDARAGNVRKGGSTVTQTIIEGMADYDMHFEPAPADKEMESTGHNYVREVLKVKQGEPVSDNNKPKLLISRELRNLTTHMANYNFDKLHEYKDFCDLVRYAVNWGKQMTEGMEEDLLFQYESQKNKVGTIGNIPMGWRPRR